MHEGRYVYAKEDTNTQKKIQTCKGRCKHIKENENARWQFEEL